MEEKKRPEDLLRLGKENYEDPLNYLIACKELGKKKFETLWTGKRIIEDKEVLAYVLPRNIPSINSLVKAGLSLAGSTDKI